MTHVRRTSGSDDPTVLRVERLLEQCTTWILEERHRKVLAEIEKVLPSVTGYPDLEAQLQLWKAQALLATGTPERALAAASRSWDLEASPHACYLAAESLLHLGETDRAEALLQAGRATFPEAPHLSLALAMLLADEGRMPEALDVIEKTEISAGEPPQTVVFRAGLHANLLASMGRWDEAMAVLDESLDRNPDSELLTETRRDLTRHHRHAKATAALAESWRLELEGSPSPLPKVEEEVARLAQIFEGGSLLPHAACRLFRAYVQATGVRPRHATAWALALLLAVQDLDGEAPATAPFARAVHVSPSSVWPIRKRLGTFLTSMDPGLARRSFACSSNPRLNEAPTTQSDGAGAVVDFRRPEGGPR